MKINPVFSSVSIGFLMLGSSNILMAAGTSHANPQSAAKSTATTKELLKEPLTNNRSYVYAGLLYLKPTSSNLKYATFVSGTQPYYQSWHYQTIKPDFSAAFELGAGYALPNTSFSGAVDWTHLNSNDSSFKQASRNTDLTTVEFVAPPYEMSPPVFGIKRVDAKVNFAFDSVLLNMAKQVDYSYGLKARFFGGINLLRVNQTLTTVFSDYAGSPATPYSYPLPPDPSFSFQTQTVSKYFGAGPDLGLNVQYQTNSGFGVVGQILGTLTVGSMRTQDNFTSTSARLTSLGIGTSHQNITAPNETQVVPGADGKLGVFYAYQGSSIASFTVEAGYRFAAYLNAISTVEPGTLVQPGTVIVTPEFSTGTMAIVSTHATNRPFNFSGPYLNLKIAMA